jgi:ferritin-like metal-binding protein YciE
MREHRHPNDRGRPRNHARRRVMMDSFDKLYIDQLKDIYNAEKQLVRTLPRIAKASTSPELRSAIEDHLEKTKTHVERLEEIFEEMGQRAAGKTCKAMQGLLEEGNEILEEKEEMDPKVVDAGIIMAAQKVEHYEIATYGSLRTLAQLKGDERAVELLQETLDEEKEADQLLTQIAETSINVSASEQ